MIKKLNLSDFNLEERHIALLSRGLSFSPVEKMDHFEIYKDLNLFLRKVYYRQIYTKERQVIAVEEKSIQDKEAVEQLIPLLEECDTAS